MDAPPPTPTGRWRDGPRALPLTTWGVAKRRIWLSVCEVCRSGSSHPAPCCDASRPRRLSSVHWSTSPWKRMSVSANVVMAHGPEGRSTTWPRNRCGAWCRTSRVPRGSPTGEMFAGESIAEMQARALQAVREIDARVGADHGPQALWALVSHGDVIKFDPGRRCRRPSGPFPEVHGRPGVVVRGELHRSAPVHGAAQ